MSNSVTPQSGLPAEAILYDNQTSGLVAENIQSAIDELNSKPSGSESSSIVVTLTTDGWIDNADGRKKQTVVVDGITVDTPVVIVDCDLSTSDENARIAILEAWKEPSANEVAQEDGALTFYCYKVPTINIPVNVGVC